MSTTAPCTVGSPVDHTLPSGPTTVMAANVVCSRSLKVALTRPGPVVTAALFGGSVDTRDACANATCALRVAVNTKAASNRPAHPLTATRLLSVGGSAQARHPERLRPEPPRPTGGRCCPVTSPAAARQWGRRGGPEPGGGP